jgi:hypothetical protein
VKVALRLDIRAGYSTVFFPQGASVSVVHLCLLPHLLRAALPRKQWLSGASNSPAPALLVPTTGVPPWSSLLCCRSVMRRLPLCSLLQTRLRSRGELRHTVKVGNTPTRTTVALPAVSEKSTGTTAASHGSSLKQAKFLRPLRTRAQQEVMF